MTSNSILSKSVLQNQFHSK